MYEVHLSDDLYKQAKFRADQAGFSSVDDYVVDLLVFDLVDGHGDSLEPENLDHLFTPTRLAIIDEAVAQLDRGECFTMDEVESFLAQKSIDYVKKKI